MSQEESSSYVDKQTYLTEIEYVEQFLTLDQPHFELYETDSKKEEFNMQLITP